MRLFRGVDRFFRAVESTLIGKSQRSIEKQHEDKIEGKKQTPSPDLFVKILDALSQSTSSTQEMFVENIGWRAGIVIHFYLLFFLLKSGVLSAIFPLFLFPGVNTWLTQAELATHHLPAVVQTVILFLVGIHQGSVGIREHHNISKKMGLFVGDVIEWKQK